MNWCRGTLRMAASTAALFTPRAAICSRTIASRALWVVLSSDTLASALGIGAGRASAWRQGGRAAAHAIQIITLAAR